MYEAHFGLDKRVFHGNDAGNGVFSGPQTAKVISGMKKAMATSDAAVALTGPVGVGKSTVARRALEAVSGKSIVIRIGRAPLGPDEVLDQMLEELGAAGLANGTIRRITVFRGALKQLEDKGARVVVIVEDAVRVGEETLVEIEALTATDGGVSNGANMVLMGDESLRDMLKSPALARLAQRIRMRQRLEAFSAGETRGYLRHCLRESGGAFDDVFATGCAELLHDLSGGVARVINNLVESVLVSAAEQGVSPVSHALIRQVADEEYGLESDLDVDTLAAAPAVDPRGAAPAAETATGTAGDATDPPSKASRPTEPPDGIPELTPVIEADDQLVTAHPARGTAAGIDDLPRLEPEPEAADIPELGADLDRPAAADIPELTPAAVDIPRREPGSGADAGAKAGAECADIPRLEPEPAAAGASADGADDFDIPELIQDTQPELAALPEMPEEINNPLPDLDDLAPALADDADAAGARPARDTDRPDAVAVTGAAKGDRPAADPAASAGKSAQDMPAWDRDPTQAELRPDIEALEQAMALARPPDEEEPDAAGAGADSEDDQAGEVVPEITLDASIQARVAAAEEDLRKRRAAEAEARAAAQTDDEMDAATERASDEPDDGPDDGLASAGARAAGPDTTGSADIAAGSADAAPDVADVGSADAPDPDRDAVMDRDREQLAKIAAGLAQARSIEDVDDQMAETLFGEEFSSIAAQVAANQPVDEPVELTLESTPEPDPVPVQAAVNEDPGAGDSDLKKEFEEVWGTSAVEVSIDSESGPRAGGLDLSASQRLATVRALNAGGTPAKPARPAAAASANGVGKAEAPKPEPIEEQITTSMTQTLKALNVRKMQEAQDDEDDDNKGGFFSRFRRS